MFTIKIVEWITFKVPKGVSFDTKNKEVLVYRPHNDLKNFLDWCQSYLINIVMNDAVNCNKL